MKCLKNIAWMFLIGCSLEMSGQQQSLYSQYMFNMLPLNPAYAGSHEYPSATVIARKQWLKIDGAPATQTFSAHAPVYKSKMGLGITAINDKIGVTSNAGLYAAYAYRIRFEKSILSMGLQAGFTNCVSRFSQLEVRTPNDPAFASDDVHFFLPNFGGGVYYYTRKFYAGFSVPHIMDHLGKRTNVAYNAVQYQHYFLTAGFVTELSPQLKLKPSVLLKAVPGAPIQADLNTMLMINEVLWVGVSYRTATSLNFIVQAMLTDQLSLGYAYDSALNKIRTINTASHEVMLNYRFIYFRKNVIAPRYF